MLSLPTTYSFEVKYTNIKTNRGAFGVWAYANVIIITEALSHFANKN